MLWDVIGVGANSVDYVYRVPAYPEPEGPRSKLRITSHWISCGGQMATTLATCASLGLRTKYVGVIGNDDNGCRIREELERRGVNLSDVVVREAVNAFAVILIAEHSGERIVLWNRGGALSLASSELPVDRLTDARVVHVDDVDQPAAIAAARAGRDAGLHVTSDIDRVTDRTEELVAAVTIPIFAEHVPTALTGEEDIERALRKIGHHHAGMLCVTLGSRGSAILHGDRFQVEPALKIQPVDTTGAGDVFRGAFIVALLRGETPAGILRYANAAAGASCLRPGAIGGVPTPETVATKMQNVE